MTPGRWPTRTVSAGLSLLAAVLLGATAMVSPAVALDTPPPPSPPGVSPTGPPITVPGGPVGGPLLTGRGTTVHYAGGAPLLPQGIKAPAWIVADLDTGQVLAARDPHARYRPASTLKTLTALTLIPRLDPKTVVPFLPQYLALATTGTHGVSSLAGLVPGSSYSIDELFDAMLLPSGNEAAEALAGQLPGGRTATLAAMNATAQSLQAFDTVAKTPDGLDADGQFSSAYDLALIARAGLALPRFAGYVGKRNAELPCPKPTKSCVGGHFQVQNHNHVLTSYAPATGVKNGGTTLARLVVVGSATQGGHRIVAVVMHAEAYPFTQTIDLLEWGFAADGKVTPIGQLVEPQRPGALPAGGRVVLGATASPVAGPPLLRGASGGGVPGWALALVAGVLGLVAVAIFSRRRVLGPASPPGAHTATHVRTLARSDPPRPVRPTEPPPPGQHLAPPSPALTGPPLPAAPPVAHAPAGAPPADAGRWRARLGEVVREGTRLPAGAAPAPAGARDEPRIDWHGELDGPTGPPPAVAAPARVVEPVDEPEPGRPAETHPRTLLRITSDSTQRAVPPDLAPRGDPPTGA